MVPKKQKRSGIKIRPQFNNYEADGRVLQALKNKDKGQAAAIEALRLEVMRK